MKPPADHKHPTSGDIYHGSQIECGETMLAGDVCAGRRGWTQVHENWYEKTLVTPDAIVVRPPAPALPKGRGLLTKRVSKGHVAV